MDSVLDRLEIADVLARYSTALDTRDWGLLADVLHPDAECDFGGLGRPRGRAAVTALVRGTLGDLDATQHLLGNVVVDVRGDEATADSYVMAQHVRLGAPGGEHYLLGGRYRDRLVRTPEGWRIAHRTLHRLWTQGNRDVVHRPATP